jgi:asparagine synthase (glutamine-hydrolysing)
MLKSLHHEDFHRSDFYANTNVGLCRVHLGIFNPESQPIFNEDRSLCIIMDGKIYGHEEELKKIRQKHKISAGNDLDYCLHSYEECGLDFIPGLNGAFVFVIYDLTNKMAIIVNDRYGLRPLYYYFNDEVLLFSSEVKSILEYENAAWELDKRAVADFFAFGRILGDKTFINKIQVLPPASILIFKDGGLSIKKYWEFGYEPDYRLTMDEMADKLVELFKKAVAIRMKDNLRYSVSLSGGLDSRSILSAVPADMRNRTIAFTFGTLESDEIKIARSAANKLGVEHRVIGYGPEDILPYSEKAVEYSDGGDTITACFEPFISDRAREFADVVMNGIPGDVTLGGSTLNKQILRTNNDEELFNILFHSYNFLFTNLKPLFNDEYYEQIKDLHKESFRASLEEIKIADRGNKCDAFHLENHVRRFTILGIVIDRNYVEDAMPFYDNDLVDFLQRIPPELRMRHNIYRKFILALAPGLSSIPYNQTMVPVFYPYLFWYIGILYQSGMARINNSLSKISKGKVAIRDNSDYTDYKNWFRDNKEWVKFIDGTLLNRDASLYKYLNYEYVSDIIMGHKLGKNNRLKISYLMTFELYLNMVRPHLKVVG